MGTPTTRTTPAARAAPPPQTARRRVLRALSGAGLLSWLPPVGATRAHEFADGVYRTRRAVMGTQVDLTVAAATAAAARDLPAACAAAFTEMARLERMMSRYQANSLVAALARAAGRHAVEVPPEMMAVLVAAAQRAESTDGAFDITVGAYTGWDFRPEAPTRHRVPGSRELAEQRTRVGYRELLLEPHAGRARLRRAGMQLDLGGIAKLPILQAGMDVLQQHGVAHALLNGGGDVLARGQFAGRPWRVGLRDPRAPAQLLGVLEIEDGVVAASGDYERAFDRDGRHYHHVLDPRSGLPTAGVRGVVLAAADVETVNGLGAAVMVAGPAQGTAWLRAARGVDALRVDQAGELALTGRMPERLSGLRAAAAATPSPAAPSPRAPDPAGR